MSVENQHLFSDYNIGTTGPVYKPGKNMGITKDYESSKLIVVCKTDNLSQM